MTGIGRLKVGVELKEGARSAFYGSGRSRDIRQSQFNTLA
jgi:hypothetical protein